MALNFLSNGIFAGDVTIPEYIYHTGNTSQDRFGFAGNDTFVIRTNGTDKFTADANSAILLEAGITKLQTTSTGISISGQATGTFSGDISTSGDGQTNTPFRLGADYNSYMVAAAGTTWGLFWAGNSGARYGTNGNGGPGNIWGNNGNPNEFVFVGSDSTKWTVYGNTGDTWQSGDIYVGGGDIILSGTGRIQGVDTVSVGTDAANKTYVDNAISGVPQGTITGGGQNLRLALWDGSSSIGSDGDFTYNGDTIFATKLSVQNQINTNSANLEINYANGDGTTTNFKNLDIRNGKNAIIASFNGASKLTTLQGDLSVNGDDFRLGAVMLQDSGAGRLGFNRDTSSGAIHDSNYNAFQIQVDTSGSSGMLEIQEYTGAGAFVGNTFITGNGITINDYVRHNGDTTTRFGFAATDTFRVKTDNSTRLDINNSGMQLGNANARVTTIYDQDTMSSNSATALATQQSIKQYVDTAVSNAGTVTGTGVSGRVAFWSATTNLSSDSNLYWDDSSNELGIGTSSPTTFLTVQGGHSTSRMNLYYPGGTNAQKAYIDMWASEPGVSYNGSGIGSNINGSPYYGRKVTEQGQTYIRFIDGQFEVYTGTNSSGTGSTAAKRFQITDSGLATFYQVPVVGTMATSDNSTRSASTAFVTTAIGNVSTGVQSVTTGNSNTITVGGSTANPIVQASTAAVSASSANLATGAQIQTAINTAIDTIPSGLAFEGNWNASTDSPDLSGASPDNGQFWIVSVAGSTNLSGITDWKVGDWAIYVATGAGTDGWQKVDNTSTLSGAGTVNALPLWTGTTSLGTSRFTQTSTKNIITGPGNTASDYSLSVTNAGNTEQFYIHGTGEVVVTQNYFYVAASQGMYSNGLARFRGGVTNDQGNLNLGGSGSIGNLALTSNTAASFAGTLSVGSITNATTDTDKFLVSDSGVVKYRTGAQVLSDIGAQASGNYLPVANPTFTGTLTGPAATITGTATVGGATLSGDTFSDPDLLLSVLSNDTTTSLRYKIGSSTALTMVSDSTAPAPGAFEVNGSYNIQFGDYHTIDEGDTFTFEFWYKFQSGTATYNLLYAGSSFYNASGQYLGNTQRYWGEAALNINANSGSDWYHVTGTLGPARGSNTSQIPTTAVSMQLLFLFNYAPNGTAITRFCGLKVYKSGKTVTQLYRKTLGSEANTTRNRDLVVDQNGDLYGSNLTITGNLIGNTSNTTELGTYSTGAIKRIRMCQGGELHFGDTTNTAPLGITEGSWNNFGDNDFLSIYGRSKIQFFAGATSAVLAATLQSTGLTLNTISNATSDTDKFLVSDSGIIKYRTGAQVLSDIGAASSGSLGNYLLLTGGTMSGTIVSTATTALEMDGASSAQGILMQADSSGTYPVFLRSLNPASGGETSPWLYKEESTPWGIWHNNPSNSFDFTRSGNNLGIANNVGGQTNSVMIRLNSTDGSGTFAGNVTSSGDVTADQFFSTNNGNGQNLKMGDDVYIGDINLANTFRVQGAQTPANGYITFGNSSNTQLGRAGTGALTWGGDFEVTGYVKAPSFTGRLQGGLTGAPDAIIWCVSGDYTDWGIFYDEGSPDLIQFKASGNTTASISLDNGDYIGRNATFSGSASIADDINITNAGGVIQYIGSGFIGAQDNFYVGGATTGTDHTYIGDTGRNVSIYNSAVFTVQSGDVRLQGTGRIQGIDSVLVGTDAANKTYVDSLSADDITALAFTGTTTQTLTATQRDTSTLTASFNITKIKAGGNGPSAENLNTVANSVSVGELEYRGFNSNSSNIPPVSDNANGVITVGQHSGNYNAQLAFSSDGNMYWRDNPSTGFGSWNKILDANNTPNGPFLPLSGGTMTGTISMGTQIFATAGNYGRGVFGVYSPSRYQHVWSMGTAYKLADAGTSTGVGGNLYGLAWSYNPDHDGVGNNAQAKAGLNHQLLLMQNGTTTFAAGSGMWTSGTITANNGQIVLNGTGRIQGVDTVSASTDAANKAYVDTKLPIANPTFTGTLTGPTISITGNSLLGNSSGDYVHVNDKLYVGATDSGNAEFWFGEGTTGDVNYGARWYWDSGYTHQWYTVNNSSETLMMSYATNDTSKVQWFRNFDMNNNKITELATPTATTDAANKAYVDAHPGTGGTVTSVATGGGLDGGTITTTGTIEVEYDGVSTNILQSGFDFTTSTIVQGDYIMVTNPGDTGTYRRVGYTKVGQLPFTNNSGDITAVTAGTGMTGGGTSGSVTLNVIGGAGLTANANDVAVDYLGTDSIIKAAPTLSSAVSSSDFLLMAASNGNVYETTFSNLPFVSSSDGTYVRTTGNQTITGNKEFAPTSTSTSYTSAAVELRESNYSGSTGAPPRISWHWGGVVASSMTIENNGTIAVRNNPGTAYERFACGNLTAHGGTFVLGSGGVGDMYLGNNATNKYFRFHTNNNQTYFDMNCGQINWREGSSTRYYFYPSTANMTINGTLTQNSDSRVKENVVEIDNCISKVQAMRGVYYNRTDFNTEVTKVGVIAQEVEAVLPELILEASDTGLKSVAYAELTAVLINAIKEQQEIIEDLKTRIIKLEK